MKTCRNARSEWLLRGVVLGFVAAMHIVVIVRMLAPPAASAIAFSAATLQLRFLAVRPVTPVAQKTLPPMPRDLKKPVASLRPSIDKPASVVLPSTKPRSLEMTWSPPATGAQTYVPGDVLLKSNATRLQTTVRLPGGERNRDAPRFRMVDPRMQGVAGVIHFIGGLAGAVDRHCLDLGAWQGMTVEERIRNHVSEDEMERVSKAYDCQTPRVSRPGQVNAFPRR